MKKPPLLFLCHRIPFPPNKGDKIRSFNILQLLNEHYDVYLGCFIDDPYDEQYVGELKKHCHQLFYRNQNKHIAKLKGLTALLRNQPITLPYYYDREMAKWSQEVVTTHAIEKVFVYSSSMAQYCEAPQFNQCQRIIDFVDVDSDKWRQYAENKSGLAKFIFQREFKTLARYEDQICQQFDASLFVSPDEAKLFRARQHVTAQAKVQGILNGVDIGFFDPNVPLASEAKLPNGPFISFTGAMDYWANVDAVLWFVENVWPIIKEVLPSLSFVIAGGNPANSIKALAGQQDIIVTGRVDDIRPFMTQAQCIVAPLRIARGIQNKVLEAMSLDKPVVCTSMAMEGINAPYHQYCQVHDEPEAFAKAVVELVNSMQESASHELVVENRAWIKAHFTWQATLAPLANLYQIESSEVTSQ